MKSLNIHHIAHMHSTIACERLASHSASLSTSLPLYTSTLILLVSLSLYYLPLYLPLAPSLPLFSTLLSPARAVTLSPYPSHSLLLSSLPLSGQDICTESDKLDLQLYIIRTLFMAFYLIIYKVISGMREHMRNYKNNIGKLLLIDFCAGLYTA